MASGTRVDRIGARQLIDRVLDPGSWHCWDRPAEPAPGADPAYLEQLRAARAATGLDEAVVTGEGRIEGRRVAVAACEFDFLAGSIGVSAAERLVACVERATSLGLPLLTSPTSGGTRMQEGTVAFVQMVKISAAIAQHRRAGLPYLVYLRHPTTGGVLASWGSLGHVTAAQPGAMIGFLGPRVYQALHGSEFPAGVQTAENLYAHGLVDAVVAPEDLRQIAARVLSVLARDAPPIPSGAALPALDPAREPAPAWESVTRSRRPDRPGVRALLKVAATDVTTLTGTGAGEQDPGLLLALARFDGQPCVLLGQDRSRQSRYGPFGPAALRTARRGMHIAAELSLPLVTVVDTAGAALSAAAEQGGLAAEIARCLAELTMLTAPTCCLLLGQGAGGGALALLPADRVVAAEHAWLSPLPPEGASALLYRTTEQAARVAADQRVRAVDLLADGLVDRIVPELPDAAEEAEPFLLRTAAALAAELAALTGPGAGDTSARLAARAARYRALGNSIPAAGPGGDLRP